MIGLHEAENNLDRINRMDRITDKQSC
jgi:hypothetical protein